jgi:A/G-specific adenine glycosylase
MVAGCYDSTTNLRTISPSIRKSFQNQIIKWSEKSLRPYFWRNDSLDHYSMLIIEILLARTRADAVSPVAKYLLKRYPTPKDLAQADIQDLENILKPLGLFRKRSKALKQTANILMNEFDGIIPDNESSLMTLPYVGRYASNALLCFSFNNKCSVVDTNVARVLRRFYGLKKNIGKLDFNKEYWGLADWLLPPKNVKIYNWGLLDIGGIICKSTNSNCNECPLNPKCLKAVSE